MSGSTTTKDVTANFESSTNLGIQAGLISQLRVNNYSPDPSVFLREREKRKLEIAQWLSPLDFVLRQREVFQIWQARTGEWLLQREEFRNWADEDRDDCRKLWCTGQRKVC